jgi:hypothetical protein
MRRLLALSIVFLLAGVLVPATSYAQQSVNIQLGGFVPGGEDSRTDGDVLVNNLDFLAFRVNDFNTGTVNGEWEFPLNDNIAASVGLGFSTRTVPSVYADYVEDDGSEIEQDLKLRVVPFTAALRFSPLGLSSPIQPYLGAGVGVFSWRYSESGEFIDFETGDVFRDRFIGSGATAGPVIFGGLAFVGDTFGVGGEIRYQSAQGELPDDQGFSGDKIDLRGFTYAATFKIKF